MTYKVGALIIKNNSILLIMKKNILGTQYDFPMWEIEKTMEVEIGIYDKNETKLKKYNIVATSEPKVVTMYNMSTWTPDRIAGVDVTRDIIEKLKLELENDIDYLNKELEAAGPLGQ